jgi:hypothetical protein
MFSCPLAKILYRSLINILPTKLYISDSIITQMEHMLLDEV